MQKGCDAPVLPKTAKARLSPTQGYATFLHDMYTSRVIEYACPVFHNSLPQYLSNEMERLQKRALQIIQPDLSYAEALVALDITSLYERRQALSNALFDQIVGDQSHKLHELLPPPTAPEARDSSNYRFVRQIGLKTPLL